MGSCVTGLHKAETSPGWPVKKLLIKWEALEVQSRGNKWHRDIPVSVGWKKKWIIFKRRSFYVGRLVIQNRECMIIWAQFPCEYPPVGVRTRTLITTVFCPHTTCGPALILCRWVSNTHKTANCYLKSSLLQPPQFYLWTRSSVPAETKSHLQRMEEWFSSRRNIQFLCYFRERTRSSFSSLTSSDSSFAYTLTS